MMSSFFSEEGAGTVDARSLLAITPCEAVLREQVAELQRENRRLQGLVSELLLRNQQLRSGDVLRYTRA